MAETKVKPQEWSNPYIFSVTGASGNQSIGAATEATVQYAVKTFDPNNNFDTSTYKYTVPVSGYYRITHTVRVDTPGAGDVQCKLLAAGSSYKLSSVNQSVASQFCHTGSIDLYLTAGQTVEGRVYNGNGTSSIVKQSDSRLSGYLISV